MSKMLICGNPKCGCSNLVRRVETQKLKDAVVKAALIQMDMWDGKIPTDYGKGLGEAIRALRESQG